MNEQQLNNLIGPQLLTDVQIVDYEKSCILICKLMRFKYEELIKNGFSESQALELCKQL